MSPMQIPTQSDEALGWAAGHFPNQEALIPAYVVAMLSDTLGIPVDQIEPSARFLEDLEADELEPVEIVLAIEEELGVFISDDDARGLGTVAELVEYLRMKLADTER